MGGLCLLLMLTAAAKVKNCLSLFFLLLRLRETQGISPGSTLSTFCRASTGGGGWSSFLSLSDKKLFLKNSMHLDWKRLKKRKLFSGQIPAPAVLPSHKHYEPLQVEVLKELIIEDLLKFWTTGTIIASRELMNIWSVKNQHFGGTESLPEYLYFSIGLQLLWTQKKKQCCIFTSFRGKRLLFRWYTNLDWHLYFRTMDKCHICQPFRKCSQLLSDLSSYDKNDRTQYDIFRYPWIPCYS